MAKVNFNNVDEIESQTQGNGAPGSDVGFFTLKNDNDEAVVRFMCDSTDDFEILTCHEVQVGGRYRKVNCIRDPREPLDNCPLCKSGARINNRFFIKMIQYDKVSDPTTGVVTVVPKAMMWERSTAYAKTLKSYLDNYGPLSDIICKIIRHGKAGDMQTTYEIVPNLSKAVYKDEIYVKETNLFGDFEAFGTVVMDRTADEMNHFLATGEFPARQSAASNAAPAQTATPVAPAPQAVPQQYAAPATYADGTQVPPQQYAAPVAPQQPVAYAQPAPVAQPQYAPAPMTAAPQEAPVQRMPWEAAPTAAPGGFERPRRY